MLRKSPAFLNETAKRLTEIVGVFLRHGFGDLVGKLRLQHFSFFMKRFELAREGQDERKRLKAPERLRMAFEELGPTFIKLGQLLSTRPDILEAEYVEEFKKLQDSAQSFPFESVEALVEGELGAPIGDLFAEFDEKPCAAASVAQVHIAQLHSGEKVAVKIQRPDILKIVGRDLRIMYKIARLVERNFEEALLFDPVAIVREFEKTVNREMDFTIEAANIEKFSRNFSSIADVHIPAVHWELTSKSILVIEYLEGVRLDDVQGMIAMGVDPIEVAGIGLRCFGKQILEDGFFHADPHPANSMVMPDGRVALIDFGIIGYVDNEMMGHIATLLVGYAEHDYSVVIRALADMEFLRDDMDLPAFKRDLIDVSEPYYGRSIKHVRMADVFDSVVKMAMKHKIKMPHNLVLLLKTLVQIEALGRGLDSDLNILETLKPYARKLLEKTKSLPLTAMEIKDDLAAIGVELKGFPTLTSKLLKQVIANKLRFEISHFGFEQFDNDFGRAVNRLTVGFVISATLIGSAQIISSQNSIAMVAMPFGIEISITTLLGLFGYNLATVLGVWLIVSIFRAGKL